MVTPVNPKTPDELSEDAWALITEAMTRGTFTLPSGAVIPLEPKDMVKIAQWLATVKAKHPRLVNAPEDFVPKDTRSRKAVKS